jgi:tRNA (cytidine32/uridine32-2'-O)-methyltransferase
LNPTLCDIVLVRPARPANVAAACRAMKNMGLGRLCLVGPPPGLESPAARGLAYGAWDVLDGAVVADSVRDAVSGSTLVVATSARAGAPAWTPRRLAAESAKRTRGGRLSVVFGPESSGLTTDEIALCHERVRIPTAPEHPSLNLAQAVLVIAYEIFLSYTAAEGVPASPATAGEIEACIDDLRRALLDVGFLNPANPGAILAELRRLIARSGPTPREVSVLRGLARQVAWAGAIARRTGPTR